MIRDFSRNGNNHVSIVTLLQTIPFFNSLEKGELRELARIVYVRWFKKDEIIFRQHEPGIGMYIICKGSVKVFRSSEFNGNEQVSTLVKHDFIGELSLVDQQRRSATAVAMEECCLVGIFRPDLLQLINRKPKLANKVLMILAQIISSRLQQKDDELIQIKEKLSNSDIIR